MTQIKAGVKKEWLFFWRSFRFGGMAIGFAVAALMGPVLIRLVLAMRGIYEETLGAEAAAEMFAELEGANGLFASYASTLEMFAVPFMPPMMFVVITLLIGGMCGGEQKRRSIIIPQTAGLTPFGYVLPKFIMFPPLVWVMTVLAALTANGACQLLLGASLPVEIVFVTGSLTGLSLMFLVCMYMFFGISLAQPKLSILFVLAANAVFPWISMTFSIDRFTPWSLGGMNALVIWNYTSGNAYYDGIGGANIVITALITLALCAVFVVGTYFTLVAKRMDNTADEVY
ncbi:MAG: hypothetical protein FWD35_01825 [Oscillospiraceae bacterium]|nr:hypothetical protein [Oscillospiraceae bacterium]